MTTGLTTPGLTNRPTGGDPAAQRQLCASDAVDPGLSIATASETAASGPNVYPNADAGVYPNVDPNVDPTVDAGVDRNADSWRIEVTNRLERYRTRRKPRTPRYPSLLLPFDAPESWSRHAPPTGSAGIGSTALAAAPARAGLGLTVQANEEPPAGGALGVVAEPRPESQPAQAPSPEPAAKVIEFPRSAAIPVFHPSDLADPVFDRDRPRIVEAPEILPPPPALGGMLIEPAQPEGTDRRADFPSTAPSAPPSPSASIARRALAALVDGVVLATALAAFAAIFLRLNPSLNPVRGPLPLLSGPTFAGALAVVAVLLWKVFEFLFVVYTGSTPGLRAARLRLVEFDGSPPNRRLRRWRVLASLLSAFSAGLGYLWCVLDQDGLCWHDRITRTHIQSKSPSE